jgi:predicted N-acetyltransferase YhbS
MPDLANLVIREMRPADLQFAAACTSGEGWVSENLLTLEGFFLHGPHGCLVAESGGLAVGICFATRYRKNGFIGELIVRPEARGKGVGAALLNHGVKYLHGKGVETVYLDGVLKAVQLYERNGFRKVCRSWRFSGRLAGKPSPYVRRMVKDDLEQVAALDRESFREDRCIFLQRRMILFSNLSYVMVEDGRVTGYILGREGAGWTSVGPWVAEGGSSMAMDLLQVFALEVAGKPISLGILDTNPQACQMVQSLGFETHPDSPWRMALGPSSYLGTSLNCFAIGSAAKG